MLTPSSLKYFISCILWKNIRVQGEVLGLKWVTKPLRRFFFLSFQVGRVALVSYLHVWAEFTSKASNQFLDLFSSLGNSQSQTVLSAWSLSPLWFGEIPGCWLDYRGQTNRFSEQHVFSCDAFSLKVSVLHDICSLHLKIRIGSFCIKARRLI